MEHDLPCDTSESALAAFGFGVVVKTMISLRLLGWFGTVHIVT
jgi:hypothetical protein